MLRFSSPRFLRSPLTRQGGALCTRRFTSQDASNREEANPKNFLPVYVHHVSKIALDHMQRHRSGWLMEQGLDKGLHINPNGTFILSFPARKGFDAGRIWYVYIFPIFLVTQHILMNALLSPRTSYDASRKQHWLSVYRQKLAVRFLLKDNGRAAASSKVVDSQQVENQIFAAVDQMISSVNQTDAK